MLAKFNNWFEVLKWAANPEKPKVYCNFLLTHERSKGVVEVEMADSEVAPLLAAQRFTGGKIVSVVNWRHGNNLQPKSHDCLAFLVHQKYEGSITAEVVIGDYNENLDPVDHFNLPFDGHGISEILEVDPIGQVEIYW